MAKFWTEAEIDLDIEDIYENLSDREVNKLIKLLAEEGEVISTNTSKNESISFLDEEWKKTLIKLMGNRHRLSNEDEEIIKQIANKL
jgi:ABC-type histidine transport system ATPase subunit